VPGKFVSLFGHSEGMSGMGNVYLNESIVQQEHRGGDIPDDIGVEEQDFADIANVANFRVSQAKSPAYCLIPLRSMINIWNSKTNHIVNDV
jgi:hypothetical protein